MPSKLHRLIYKRVVSGDRLKLEERSHTAPTGGGARDARFRPWDRFEPIVNRMFGETEVAETSRGGARVEVTVRKAPLHWRDDSGDVQKQTVRFWPPTNARPNEGRLAQISKIPPFAPDRLPKPEDGAAFWLLWEDDRGVWGRYVSEGELRSGAWHSSVVKPILESLDESREAERDDANLCGYIDFRHNESEHFGV